ncbi:hypothetical protein PsYK624_059710 [Phanerochaete sordida]|uniref:F-box domain-containing protein n=1 Tax=Phanerochaete sordida TaxID=48140 RepID=A0A9P3LBV2_9APHY|nr:hypothetical protein PsYK624_059710 [Phanerochaete sordida]
MSSNVTELADNGLADLLPVEITDIIFDNLPKLDYSSLRPPRKSIFACSLVCKSWAHRTFRHRFRSISLTVESQDSECGQEEFSVRTFLKSELFERSRDAVQTLSLRCKDSVRPDAEQQQQVHTLLRSLDIQTLKLDGVASIELATLRLDTPLSLRRLVITDSNPHPERSDMHKRRISNALHHVLCSFTSIGELHILSPHEGWLTVESNAAEPQAISDRPPAHVASLVVRFAPINGFLNLLQRLSATAPLERLDVLGQPGDTYYIVFMMAAVLAPPRHLLFSISPLTPTRIRAYPGLRQLTIAVELQTASAALRPVPQPPRMGVRVRRDPPSPRAPNVNALDSLSDLLQALHSESRVEHIELLFVPAQDEFIFKAERASLPGILNSMEAELRSCEDPLVRLVQERGLKRVSVALNFMRPWAQNLDTDPFTYGFPSFRNLFAQLHGLGVLDC